MHTAVVPTVELPLMYIESGWPPGPTHYIYTANNKILAAIIKGEGEYIPTSVLLPQYPPTFF